ncbi:uncharacterized protein LOC144137578 [Haemaphysalis longicornis]
MKGVDDDTFHMLVSKNPRSVTEVIGLCQSFDELRRQRALVCHSLPTTESLSSLTFSSNQLQLEAKIKQFVREEVARQLSLVPFTEQASSSLPSALQATIREQVAEALPPANVATAAVAPLAVPQVAATVAAPLTATVAAAPAVMPMTYADCLAQPVHPSFRSFRPAIPAVAPPTLQRAPQFPPTRPPAVPYGNPWRTPDNRPTCFSCCCPGHVARYCRRVASSPRVPQTSAYAARPPHHNVSSRRPPIAVTPSPLPIPHAPPLRPHSRGKLIRAVPEARTAYPSKYRSPHLPPQNVIDVLIDGVPALALVDTGAAVSVISAKLCRSLKKVTTPLLGLSLQTASSEHVAPLAACTARVAIQNNLYTIEFAVLPMCSHDVILGWDFLSNQNADTSFVRGLSDGDPPEEPCDVDPPAGNSSRKRASLQAHTDSKDTKLYSAPSEEDSDDGFKL